MKADSRARIEQIERHALELVVALESDGSAVGRFLASQVGSVCSIARAFAKLPPNPIPRSMK